ncbi:MAG: WG repeat-containing protein [Planctomycetota bacterium]
MNKKLLFIFIGVLVVIFICLIINSIYYIKTTSTIPISGNKPIVIEQQKTDATAKKPSPNLISPTASAKTSQPAIDQQPKTITQESITSVEQIITKQESVPSTKQITSKIEEEKKYPDLSKETLNLTEETVKEEEKDKSSIALFPILLNDKIGYIDEAGKIVIEPQFQVFNDSNYSFDLFPELMWWSGLLVSRWPLPQPLPGGKQSRVSERRRLQLSYTSYFFEGLASVLIDGKWGYIDITGKIVIKPQFVSAWNFSEGLAYVQIDDKNALDKNAYIDKTGQIVIGPKEHFTFYPGGFSDGLARISNYVKEKNISKQGWINKEGNVVIKPQFDFLNCGDFSEGLAAARLNNIWGYIDKKGIFIINPQFTFATRFSEELAAVSFNDIWGYTNKSGYIVTPFEYNNATPFSEGLAAVKIKNKWGFINKKWDITIKPQFDDVGPQIFSYLVPVFSEGMAAVRIGRMGEKWGYIDKSGNMVIKPEFDEVGNFHNGLAQVIFYTKGSFSECKIGYIDKTGKYVWEPTK